MGGPRKSSAYAKPQRDRHSEYLAASKKATTNDPFACNYLQKRYSTVILLGYPL